MTEFKTLTDKELYEVTGGKSIVEVLACLMMIANNIPEVQNAINLIKQNNLSEALKCLNELIQDGHPEIMQCIS